jgi:Transglutaminase-like superfamily
LHFEAKPVVRLPARSSFFILAFHSRFSGGGSRQERREKDGLAGISLVHIATMKRLFRYYKYFFAWENGLLLLRAVHAARLVRECLGEAGLTPGLAPSVQAVAQLYLPPQPGWRISNPEKIIHLARILVNVPAAWGRCVQQSLIAYRLLNGYGVPARICFGVSRTEPLVDGHAWIVRLSEPDRAFGESADPRERFQVIYSSPLPNVVPRRD